MATRERELSDDNIMSPSELGSKLVTALRSVSDPQALMQSISDRAVINLRGEVNARIESMDKATTLWHEDLVRVPTEVQKAVLAVRELMEQYIQRVQAELKGDLGGLSTRLQGDFANASIRIDQLEKVADERPHLIKDAIQGLSSNIDEKLKVFDRQFANIQIQFEERDTRQETGRVDSNKAIDAAFASADKAINKTESGFKDQITEQGRRIDTVSKSADEKTTALKELINDQKDRITALEARTQGMSMQKQDTAQTHTQGSQQWGLVFGVVGMVFGMVGMIGVIVAVLRGFH